MSEENASIYTACEVPINIKYLFTECCIYKTGRKNYKLPESFTAALNQDPNSLSNSIKFIVIGYLTIKI
jgi:hypothetical protein